ERASGVHVRERLTTGEQLVESRQQVVADHEGDPHPIADAGGVGGAPHGLGTGARVHATGIRDHPHAAIGDVGQDALDHGHEVARVAHGGIAAALLLQDRHRDLGEVVEHEVVDLAPLHLAHGRLEPIAPESLPARDPHRPVGLHCTSSLSASRASSCVHSAPATTRARIRTSGWTPVPGATGQRTVPISTARGVPGVNVTVTCRSPATSAGDANRYRASTSRCHVTSASAAAAAGDSATYTVSPRTVAGGVKRTRPNAKVSGEAWSNRPSRSRSVTPRSVIRAHSAGSIARSSVTSAAHAGTG